MPVNYISTLLTREEFFDKAYQKGKSRAHERLTKSALSNFDSFCLDKYGFETKKIMEDLREEIADTQDVSKVLKLLQDFVDWLDENGEEPEPLLKEELKLIIENITNPRRRTMIMFMKDTRARILETLRVKKNILI